ncbi:MAG: septum formation initiator family protein [Actinomycetota bacterium]
MSAPGGVGGVHPRVASSFGQRKMMFVVLVAGAAFILFFPARQLVEQRQRIASLEGRLVQLHTENDLLEQDVKRLEDPAELEVLARERLGLVKPGERAYYVEPVEVTEQETPRVEEGRAWWERTWERFTSLIRGGD